MNTPKIAKTFLTLPDILTNPINPLKINKLKIKIKDKRDQKRQELSGTVRRWKKRFLTLPVAVRTITGDNRLKINGAGNVRIVRSVFQGSTQIA